MLDKLRNIFGRGEHRRSRTPPVCESAGRNDDQVVLLSRRFTDPLDDLPGFRESYYCTQCRDYFVLAWHTKSSPLVKQCEVVQNIPDRKGSAPNGVFCPKCQSDYAIYGCIEKEGLPLDQDAAVHVYEALDYPFPPDVPSTPAGRIKIESLTVEKVVMLVTGEFPQGMNVRDFAHSGFTATVLSRHGGDLWVSQEGGIRLHLIRVSTIVDETSWLMPLLQREVYKTKNWGTKIFLTYGMIELKPPLGRALFCLVLSDA